MKPNIIGPRSIPGTIHISENGQPTEQHFVTELDHLHLGVAHPDGIALRWMVWENAPEVDANAKIGDGA